MTDDSREVPTEVLYDPRYRVPRGERIGVRTKPTGGRGRRRTALLSVAVVIAVLVLAEGAFRVLPSLPPPIRWDDTETQYKQEEMQARTARGVETPVVYLGSSIMDAAIAPELVSQEWAGGRNGYNAGVEGMDGRSIGAWAQYIVEPASHAKVVVIGLTVRELNDNGNHQAAFDSTFFTSRGWRQARGIETWSDDVTDFAEAHSALVRARTRIRDPYSAITYWRTGSAPAWSTPNVPGTGRITQFDDLAYQPPQQLARQTVFNRLHIGGAQVRALRRAISALQHEGVEVVLVEPAQLTTDLLQLMTASQLNQAHQAITDMARDFCAPLIDLRDAVPDKADFNDELHVNHAGTVIESKLLGQQLAGLPMNLKVGC